MDLLQAIQSEWSSLVNRLGMIDVLVFGINFLLMLLARPLIKFIFHDDASEKQTTYRVYVIRALNLFIIIAFGYYHLYSVEATRGVALKVLSVLGVIYFSYLVFYILAYYLRIRFGKTREVEGETRKVETYNSRLLTVISGFVIFIITVLSIIQILEFSSLLQAGGVLGIIGVFLALTQNSWAPDIFSGLIILNSGMVEEGDVVELGGDCNILGVVFKTRMFHTELLNLVNNHRILIRNTRLREYMIHNLSRFASARGMRERICFNIGYQVHGETVHAFFEKAFKQAEENTDIAIEFQYPLEVQMQEAGDYAVKWCVFYYTKEVKNILKTRARFQEFILRQSIEQGVSLATPVLYTRTGQAVSGDPGS